MKLHPSKEKILSAYEKWELPALDKDISGFEVLDSLSSAEIFPELPTAETLARIQEEARNEAFLLGKKEGYEVGYQIGISEGQAELNEKLEKLSGILNQLSDPINHQAEDLEKVLLCLVENIARKILKRELLIDSQGILIVLREALDSMPQGTQRVRIYCHPQDHDLLKTFLGFQPEYESHWRLMKNERLSPGGCVIETDALLIDATIDGRLNALLNQMYQKGEVQINTKKVFISKNHMLAGSELLGHFNDAT